MTDREDISGSPFEPGISQALARTIIAPNLIDALADQPDEALFEVIIDFDARFAGGVKAARHELFALFDARQGETTALFAPDDRIGRAMSLLTDTYAFAKLRKATVRALGEVWREAPAHERLIYKIWLNQQIKTKIHESVRTVKCDAARIAFGSAGRKIVWAVADTGIDDAHPHFRTHGTLDLPAGLSHADFTNLYGDPAPGLAPESLDLVKVPRAIDVDGHGTHVAGIIAGETIAAPLAGEGDGGARQGPVRIAIAREARVAGEDLGVVPGDETPCRISGMAPQCQLLSLRVLTRRGAEAGTEGSLIAALTYIRQINGDGRDMKVHGVNISLGLAFDATHFAAGQSPLCREVDRLVRSGVVVVVAAGNGGYASIAAYSQLARVSLGGTIDDPGNAALAITVGSAHRTSPHLFGVSYFSAKGPTADGRTKPDLVAPGERIVSCALGGGAAVDQALPEADHPPPPLLPTALAPFKEESGTSMAAPHVSGAIAAFLSVRREYIGQPGEVKALLMRTATDLGRRPEYQGAGLVDLMRALQAV